VSRDLSKKRGPAMYGYEAELRPASDIFDEEDAEDAISAAKEVFDSCENSSNFTLMTTHRVLLRKPRSESRDE